MERADRGTEGGSPCLVLPGRHQDIASGGNPNIRSEERSPTPVVIVQPRVQATEPGTSGPDANLEIRILFSLSALLFPPEVPHRKKKRVYDTSEYVGLRDHPPSGKGSNARPPNGPGIPHVPFPLPEPFSFARHRSLPHVGPPRRGASTSRKGVAAPAHSTGIPSPMECRTPGYRPGVASHNGNRPPVKRSQLTTAGGPHSRGQCPPNRGFLSAGGGGGGAQPFNYKGATPKRGFIF